ncbi:hypothetical protein Tco_1125171 [Tanacetum coccineum]|uniref:CCHC-type domain-containing protein n=1 Tax=Tanacetum coccineum TaxID=301880 RepID=A0ABQ5J883_9ASTR
MIISNTLSSSSFINHYQHPWHPLEPPFPKPLRDQKSTSFHQNNCLSASESNERCMVAYMLWMEERISALKQIRDTEAIAEYERSRANPKNAGGSGPANTRGAIAPNVHGCLYKKFLNYDIEGYNSWFHELALMCPDLVTPEKKKIERYIRGLPERVKANVTSSKPASLHDAINMARELIEQAIQAKAARIGESNKIKRQEAAKAYAAALTERKGYLGNRPMCNQCNLHHDGQCTPKCRKCKRIGHQTWDCWSKTHAADPSPSDDANA